MHCCVSCRLWTLHLCCDSTWTLTCWTLPPSWSWSMWTLCWEKDTSTLGLRYDDVRNTNADGPQRRVEVMSLRRWRCRDDKRNVLNLKRLLNIDKTRENMSDRLTQAELTSDLLSGATSLALKLTSDQFVYRCRHRSQTTSDLLLEVKFGDLTLRSAFRSSNQWLWTDLRSVL